MRLAVELHGTISGTLEGNARAFDFVPSSEGIERFGTNSPVLSVAIPLTPKRRRDHAGRRRNWFGELLPEGDQYDYMLEQGGLRAGDTLGFLARYGRDVAGALQLWDLDDPTEPQVPGTRPRASMIFDEEYGSRIARQLGLSDFDTWIEEFDGLPTLVIERYDRVQGARVHQEDFSQALGANRNQKYQEIGGIVSLRRIAEILKRHAPEEDLRRLARMVILAVGIGNLDMHTKNIGLLHAADGTVQLAPAYDVVPQAHFRNDGKLALAVNRRYRHVDITKTDLHAEFTAWGLRRGANIVSSTLDELTSIVSDQDPIDGAYPALKKTILSFLDNLRH